jgi:GNAT superfamily N-acetyltransferase
MLIAQRTASEVPWVTQLNDPQRLALVGTLQGHVVGYGLAKLETVDPLGLVGVVEEVWVEPEARGVGVGEVVMTTIRTWCLAAGCCGIDAAALPGDRIMKGFFERFGMSARLLVMHHRFTDAETAP